MLLARAAGRRPEQVIVTSTARPSRPTSPPNSHRPIAALIRTLAAEIRRRRRGAVIVEGVGGLLVPIADGYVFVLAAELEFPLLVAARPGLGTINHTLLTRRRRARRAAVAADRPHTLAEAPDFNAAVQPGHDSALAQDRGVGLP